MIDWGIGSSGGIDINGPLFTKDVGKTIRKNVEDAVDVIAKEGLKIVRANLATGIANPTGITAGGVEGGALHRHDLLSGAEVGSLYGRVRMAPGLSRGGSAAYPAARVPYIVNRVLESGHYGGSRVSRSVRKTGWKAGRTQRSRKAIHQFRDAYRRMKAMAADIRADLTRGLD